MQLLLSSDIRSEGSIAIVKKIRIRFFLMIFDSTSIPQSKNVFQKKCLYVRTRACVSVCRRSQSLNQSTDLIQIRYIGSSCKYLESFFLVFPLPLKLREVHMRKKFKILIFSKTATTILIKFCGFIVKSKPNNMTPSAFPGKIPETRKIVFNFLSVA